MSARAVLAEVLGVVAPTGEWRWGVGYTTTDCAVCVDHGMLQLGEDASHRKARISCESIGVRWQLGVCFYHRAGPDSSEWNVGVVHPWAHNSPAEALEALHSAALWPWSPGDPKAPRWLCFECDVWGSPMFVGCERCAEQLHPLSIPALVAVASLGASALLRAASLAEDIARAAGHPKARLVWRVMTRAAIEEHHRKAFDDGASAPAAFVAGAVAVLHPADLAAMLGWMDGDYANRPLAAAVVALHRTEDGTATGVHLVGLDAGAVTLAVEGVS